MKTRLFRIWFFVAVVVAEHGIFTHHGAALAADATAPAADRIVVMISLDGLAGYYLDDAKAELTTVRQLAHEGARAAAMKASNPTVTWPNHTTLVTGVEPARHGVVGNNYYDRLAGRKVTLIGDPTLDKDQIVKVPTIYDIAKADGLKTAAIRWPATRNASSLDWTTPDVGKKNLTLHYTTPSLLEECKQAGLPMDRDSYDGNEFDLQGDAKWTKLLNLILQKHRPNLALLHLTNVDHIEHLSGPKSPEAYAAIKEVDDEVHQVWDELKRDFPGKATLIIVSDHGFSPIERSILPNVVLRDAGLVKTTGNRVTGGAVQLVTQGGSALIYVLDEADRAAVANRVKQAFSGVDGVAKIVGSEDFANYGIADPKRDPHSPDIILFGKEGFTFGDTAAGELPFVEKPERKGSHGHDAELPDLHATFVAWGYGIKPGVEIGPIDNTSVAPTIAKLLGISMPNVDGKPLAAALSD